MDNSSTAGSEATIYDEGDTQTESSIVISGSTNGGSSSDTALDELDGQEVSDPGRKKAAVRHMQNKIHRIMELIKQEQNQKEENVNEYLRLSVNADRQQMARIKTVFEKKNAKSTSSLAQLQRKLESYHKRLQEVEAHGVSSHRMAKDVLKDVGQGIKDVGANIRDGIIGIPGGVVDNIRGAKEIVVTKPKEFAHLIKNKFGSADNITSLKTLDDQEMGEDSAQHSGTLPASFKYPSDEDEASSITSGSGPSAAHSSPHPALSGALESLQPVRVDMGVLAQALPTVDLEPILRELREQREAQHELRTAVENIKLQMQNQFGALKQALDEERYRYQALEDQYNDLTELHQHEITNIKQELSSMEDKMEYQLEERTRDMADILDGCQTRITKMELQQQQQHYLSVEGIEHMGFRTLLTKMINVVLALLAVILVFVSTMANLLGPFLTTRLRILSTLCLVFLTLGLWHNWTYIRELCHHAVTHYRDLLPKH